MKTKTLLTAMALAGITSCNIPQQLVPQKYNPQFSYTPEQRTEISQNSLTVSILDPVFSDGEKNVLKEPYKSFVGNMSDDIEEVLNANGFKIKGPFKNRDEMVYTDKLNSDFAMEVEVEILSEQGDFGKRNLATKDRILYGDSAYRLGGTYYHKGRIILTATDPIDGEKFWKKTIDLERKAVITNGYNKFTGPVSSLSDSQMLNDVGIYNPIAKVLEAYYGEALANISRQIDPREMAAISKEIKAKRKRVGQ